MNNGVDDQAHAREIYSFQVRYNKSQIKSTWAIGAAIVITFMLEEYFGGSQNVAVLVRMGANVSELVKNNNEYYRLMSSVFLHAGLMHVFFNTYVLFALGGFFNRILGESRYLCVFFVSGICGSLASVFLGKAQVSVGASGAIWGLFGASLALAVFKTDLIPELIRLRLRKITLINLIINLGVSFLPMIDFWAHIGGGVGGFLVSMAIIFKSDKSAFYSLGKWLFNVVAAVLLVIYATCLSYGIVVNKPWVDPLDYPTKEVSLVEVPFALSIPTLLEQKDIEDRQLARSTFVFGDLSLQGLAIEIHFFSNAQMGTVSYEQWLDEQMRFILQDPSVSSEIKKSAYIIKDSPTSIIYFSLPPKNGFVVHNFVLGKDEYGIKISIVSATQVRQSKVVEFAKTMVLSLKSQ